MIEENMLALLFGLFGFLLGMCIYLNYKVNKLFAGRDNDD